MLKVLFMAAIRMEIISGVWASIQLPSPFSKRGGCSVNIANERMTVRGSIKDGNFVPDSMYNDFLERKSWVTKNSKRFPTYRAVGIPRKGYLNLIGVNRWELRFKYVMHRGTVIDDRWFIVDEIVDANELCPPLVNIGDSIKVVSSKTSLPLDDK
jgi:hypothetical protein